MDKLLGGINLNGNIVVALEGAMSATFRYSEDINNRYTSSVVHSTTSRVVLGHALQ
jgi:phage gp45-like